MKLSKFVVALAALAMAGVASAQFARVGDQAQVNLSYQQTNAPQTSSWQGAELTVMAPLGKTDLSGQTIRFNADVLSGYLQTHGGVESDRNVGYMGLGTTAWLNFDFKDAGFALAPYVRLGVQGNSGNFESVNHHYFAYNVEPGVVAKMGDFYALGGYVYGEGFNASVGSTVNKPVAGLGVNVTKDFAIEGRYEWNGGSYRYDRVVAGLVYKF